MASYGAASNPITLTGGTFLAAGTFSTSRQFALGDSGGNGDGTFSINSGITLSLNGTIAGLTGLIKQGPGILTLNGPLTYTGSTKVLAGTLLLGPGELLPSQSILSIAPGAIFDTGGQSTSVAMLQDALLSDGTRARKGLSPWAPSRLPSAH